MSSLNYMNKKLEEIKLHIRSSPFDKDDMRCAYFQFSWDILDNYYKQFIWIQITNLINKGQVHFDISCIEEYKHIDRLAETTKYDLLYDAARSSANRSLIIDSWSIFEFCLTYICKETSSETEANDLLESKTKCIKKILKNHQLTETEEKRINKELSEKRLSHVSVNKKYQLLFKKAQSYSRDKKKDTEFLEFFGRLRNLMHSNYVFHGNDSEYEYNGVTHVFQDGQSHSCKNSKPNDEYYFDAVLNLNSIFSEISKSLKYNNIIRCPI